MNRSLFNITIILALFSSLPVMCSVKILYTAAIINKHYEMRKEEFLHCLKTLQAFGYEPYIVESICQAPTFFDNYTKQILYTQTNNPSLHNKGVNEAISMAAGMRNFDDNDMIVKISGRCYFTSDKFLRQIEQDPEADAFVKYDPQGQVFTGCFALRAKYLKELLASINYTVMETHMINFEKIVAQYIENIKRRGAKIRVISDVGLIAHYFGNGNTRVITYR